jgi:hypothetical protein
MLEDAQHPAGPHHPPQLAQPLFVFRVRDVVEHARRERHVERPVRGIDPRAVQQ